MRSIYHKWNCWNITSSDQYVATFGSGVTVLKRSSLEEVCHFTGIKHITGGMFLNDDVLVVFTTEQKIFFLTISGKKILWTCPRSRKLSAFGDVRCYLIPGTQKIACITTGKKSLEEHYFMLVDYGKKTVALKEIQDCYRVVHSLIWMPDFGLAFLSYEAKGDGNLLYKITGINDTADCVVLYEWESPETVNAYFGKYIFMNSNKPSPSLKIYQLTPFQQAPNLVQESTFQLPSTSFQYRGPVQSVKKCIPKVTWFDDCSGLLIGHTSDWIGVYDIFNQQLVTEYSQSNISFGTIIDEKLLVGCLPGLFADEIDTKR